MFRQRLVWLILLMVAVPVQAQIETWDVVLYDNTRLLVVGPEGVTDSINLPEEVQNLRMVAPNALTLSPDRQHLAFASVSDTPDGGFTTSLKLANLATGECCFEPPDAFVRDFTYLLVGPFNPDSTLLMVSAVRWLPDMEQYESYMLAIDVATGYSYWDPDNGISYFNDPGSLWHDPTMNTSLLPEWTPDRLTFFPACVPCDGTFEGRAWRWNLETGEVKQFDRYYSSLGDRLALTGEYLYAAENPDYPVVTGNFPVQTNVITYLSHGGASQEPIIVYQKPEDSLFVPKPNWVLDGAAYLLHPPAQATATLVHRDGSTESLTFDSARDFLVGTPDGWFMIGDNDGERALFHYTRTASGDIDETILGALMADRPQMLYQPALGTSAHDPLTPVAPR